MLKPTPTTKFKKDLKKFEHRKRIIQDLDYVIKLLVKQLPLEKNISIIHWKATGRVQESVM